MSAQISVSDESKAVLDKIAKDRDVPVAEAANFMIGVAVSRLNALRRYAKKQDGEAVAPKAKAKKPAKKKATKKAVKAA